MNRSLIHITILIIAIFTLAASADRVLIPMDLSQPDHLKAYGVARFRFSRRVSQHLPGSGWTPNQEFKLTM